MTPFVNDAAYSENSDSLLLWDRKNRCKVIALVNDSLVKTIQGRAAIELPGQDPDTVLNALYKLYNLWGIDLNGKAIIIDEHLTLTLNVPNNYHSIYSGVLSPDTNLLFTTGKNKAGTIVGNFYDLKTGAQVSATMVQEDSIYLSRFNREGNKFMTFSTKKDIRFYTKILPFDVTHGDLDFPVKLFRNQLESVCGAKLDSMNNLVPLDRDAYNTVTKNWMEKAEEHYKTCKFKSYNYWAHCFPEKAKLYAN
jgi:hypothetical protein